jgi:hypothetical protein
LGPGPSRPGLGFWGSDGLAPHLAIAALALPLAVAALGCFGGGVRVHPSPLYKDVPRGGGEHTSSTSPSSLWPSPTSSLVAGHLNAPLYLSCMVSRRVAQVGDLSTAAHCPAAEFLDPCPTLSSSAILAGTRIL